MKFLNARGERWSGLYKTLICCWHASFCVTPIPANVGIIVQTLKHVFVYLRRDFSFHPSLPEDSAMREDQAKIKRAEWAAKGRPPCEHRTLKLLYTVENYITGDYVCAKCGEQVGKVLKNGGPA